MVGAPGPQASPTDRFAVSTMSVLADLLDPLDVLLSHAEC